MIPFSAKRQVLMMLSAITTFNLSFWSFAQSPKIVAHRAICSDLPENSLAALEACINIGADYVEIDVRKTSDDYLVLMHDPTLERTTNCHGQISQYSFSELQSCHLKDRLGIQSSEKIPTLGEVLQASKGRIKVNIDDKSGGLSNIAALVVHGGYENTVLMKSTLTPVRVSQELGSYSKVVSFMPVLRERDISLADLTVLMSDYSLETSLIGVELVFSSEDSAIFNPEAMNLYRHLGIEIWVNTLTPELCAGRDDQVALNDPESSWGWFFDKGVTMLQTDYPREMKDFFEERSFISRAIDLPSVSGPEVAFFS